MTSGWERHANARGKAKRDKCKWIPLSLRVFAAGNLTNDVAIPRLTCLELLVHLFRICRDNWETVFGKVGFPAGPWQATGLRCSSLSIVRGRQFLKPLVLCVCVRQHQVTRHFCCIFALIFTQVPYLRSRIAGHPGVLFHVLWHWSDLSQANGMRMSWLWGSDKCFVNPTSKILILWGSWNNRTNIWLVVLTMLKHISQWEGLSHILWKIKNVPNHQPDMFYH